MPFCATCGAQVEGRFCAKCGSPVAAAAPGAGTSAPLPPPGAVPGSGYPPPSGYAPPPGTMGPPVAAAPMADNVASALCYVLGFITGIIFLVIAPYNQNRTVRFHAFQSIFLFFGLFIIRVILGSMILGPILFHGFYYGSLWVIYGLFWSLFGLACLILWIYLIIQAYQGKTVVLPVVGPLAQKQA
jgi:uncharacterized membrane protein